MKLKILLISFIILLGQSVFALQVEPLKDPALEKRAKDLSLELRCLVCQNQSIESSDADLAVDLKIIVREQISAGKTDYQIKQYLVERYGEFVLLNPLVNAQTSFLWLTPILFLGIAFLFAFFYFRNMKAPEKQEK